MPCFVQPPTQDSLLARHDCVTSQKIVCVGGYVLSGWYDVTEEKNILWWGGLAVDDLHCTDCEHI